jgi:tetratricopeptide (TPR) repeat protein
VEPEEFPVSLEKLRCLGQAGCNEEALALTLEWEQLSSEIGDLENLQMALFNRVQVLRAMQVERADILAVLERQERLVEETQDPLGRLRAMLNRADLEGDAGDFESALRLYERVGTASRQIKSDELLAQSLVSMVMTLHRLGRTADAERQVQAAHRMALKTEDNVLIAQITPYLELAGRRLESRQRRPGPNQPCWCGSGKKYKRCHRGQPDDQ